MSDGTTPEPPAPRPGSTASPYGAVGRPQPANLADLLERVLDKGVVLAGDIRVNLLDIELLTIKIRLLLVSVDKAAEMGIDWWRTDPELSSQAAQDHRELREENARLRRELEAARERTDE
ncbi:MAG TPA: gas vesicle protein [Microlunatus sp.]|nr:gas vesicle protein [Microlunatus sp.]